MEKSLTRRRLDAFIHAAAQEADRAFAHDDRIYLDLGCGGGPYTHIFKGWERIGMDFAPRTGVDVVGDVHTLPFEDEHFDLILSTELLEHVARPAVVIDEMHRVLKGGGILILSTRFCFPINQAPHDHFRYTSYGLTHLLTEAGFTVNSLVPDTTSLEAIGVQYDALAKNSTASKPVKAFLYGCGWLMKRLPKLTRDEFGDMRTKNTVPVPHIISSGYHVIARK